MAVPARDRADACPGVLTPHPADDGPLVRLRVPGGALARHQLRTLAGCAEHASDRRLHLTSRANVQVRGTTDTAALARTLTEAGLLPSSTHERVRNILVSPLSGISGGTVDVRPLRDALDRALCADPTFAMLPGRFQFGIDDGRGDLPLRALDVGWRALDDAGLPDATEARDRAKVQRTAVGTMVLAGNDSGLRVPLDVAVPAMIEAARAFRTLRNDAATAAWHVHEVDPDGSTIAAAVLRALPDHGITPARTSDSMQGHSGSNRGHTAADPLTSPFGTMNSGSGPTTPLGSGRVVPPPVGVLPHDLPDDGDARAVHAVAPLGALTMDQLHLIAGLATHGVVITPWRSLLLPGLDPIAATRAATRLEAAGLVLDPTDPWPGVTACIGRPGCASARADVRGDATSVVSALPTSGRVHLSGCERRCGSPRGSHVDAVATEDGYAVNGTAVAASELASTVARAAARSASDDSVEPTTSTRASSPHHTRGAAR